LTAENNEKAETYTMGVLQMSEWHKVTADVQPKFGSVDLLMPHAGASFKPEGGKV
jgi:hypothetical protein